jgi:hypothetical protein
MTVYASRRLGTALPYGGIGGVKTGRTYAVPDAYSGRRSDVCPS